MRQLVHIWARAHLATLPRCSQGHWWCRAGFDTGRGWSPVPHRAALPRSPSVWQINPEASLTPDKPRHLATNLAAGEWVTAHTSRRAGEERNHHIVAAGLKTRYRLLGPAVSCVGGCIASAGTCRGDVRGARARRCLKSHERGRSFLAGAELRCSVSAASQLPQ